MIAAELLAVDPERGLWGVSATFEDGGCWEYDDEFEIGEALTSRTQVVHVHRNGIPRPAPVRDLRAEALRCAGSISEHIDPGLYEVADQIRGLTLAVLALTDRRA
ncbi:hypothetical protein ACGF07_31875 [Kitasatospora sp. NPDC048194]|uniref:hypothetical protein n=1 Tax=Kitasatospora sp. NPDC048194 TaxID=3364045 RepID=UPI0037236DA6